MKSLNGITYHLTPKPDLFQDKAFLSLLYTYFDQTLESDPEYSVPEYIFPLLYDRILNDHGDHTLKKHTLQDIQHFFQPKIKNIPMHYGDIPQLTSAAQDLYPYLINGKPVGLFTDYDVDGGTSAALLYRYFKYFHCPVYTFVPHRIKHGYGVNVEGIKYLRSLGAQKIIVLDSGTLAQNVFQEVGGDDILVLDHHQLDSSNNGSLHPDVSRFINVQCASDYWKPLCTAGIAFFFILAMNDVLKKNGTSSLSSDMLLSFLPLVALGTVCDMVPLIGINRILVHVGLKVLNAQRQRLSSHEHVTHEHVANEDVTRETHEHVAYETHESHTINLGLDALCKFTFGPLITEKDFGFSIGPKINACSRMGHDDLALRLLTTDNPEKAKILAQQAYHLNTQRKQMETLAFQDAQNLITQHEAYVSDTCICVKGDYDLGIIGILASKIKELFGKPTLVYSNTLHTGSGRSVHVEGHPLNLGRIIHQLVQDKKLSAGGGHAMAVGFTTFPDTSPQDLGKMLDSHITQQYNKLHHTKNLTCSLLLQEVNHTLIHIMDMIAPFGSNNPEPVFLFEHVYCKNIKIINDKHVFCTLTNNTGHTIQGIAWNALAYNAATCNVATCNVAACNAVQQPIGLYLQQHTKDFFSLIGTVQKKQDMYLKKDVYQIIIQDVIQSS